LRKRLADIEVELAELVAAERVVGRMLAEPGAVDVVPGVIAAGAG